MLWMMWNVWPAIADTHLNTKLATLGVVSRIAYGSNLVITFDDCGKRVEEGAVPNGLETKIRTDLGQDQTEGLYEGYS